MKPMLAAATNGQGLRYPLLVSPKLDGVRALVLNGVVVSRSLKPIPNKHVQQLFGNPNFNGLDGELIVGPPTAPDVFRRTSSEVMSLSGEPEVFFFLFDDFKCYDVFQRRFESVVNRAFNIVYSVAVPHYEVRNEMELMSAEETALSKGYEGLMIRDPEGQYKFGRSTPKQGWLLKLKRFEDSEAKVLGVTQYYTNTNEAKVNELGEKARSHKKEGMVPCELIGALTVQDLKTGVEFEIGTGFDHTDRHELWVGREDIVGKVVKYKYQAVGVKDKPRFPVFLGFRDGIDL